MLVRAIALSLALLLGIGILIPLATDQAEAGAKQVKRKKRNWRGVKKYSKRWWQLYRAQERRKKALAKKRRSLRLRQLRLAELRKQVDERSQSTSAAGVPGQVATKAPAVLPSGQPAPTSWSPSQSTAAQLQFRVDNSTGAQVGSATISVVGPATESSGTRNTIGGLPTTSLRREVIDRMIRENGWVVNDYQKEIGGQRVYVVLAQSQSKDGGLQSRQFYFTEVDGRVYNVATHSPVGEAERLAEESEKVINSLKARVRPAIRAAKD